MFLRYKSFARPRARLVACTFAFESIASLGTLRQGSTALTLRGHFSISCTQGNRPGPRWTRTIREFPLPPPPLPSPFPSSSSVGAALFSGIAVCGRVRVRCSSVGRAWIPCSSWGSWWFGGLYSACLARKRLKEYLIVH